MSTTRISESLAMELYKISQSAILTPENLGVFKQGTKDEVLVVLEQIDINELLNLNSREEYDQWYDELVMQFHLALFSSYRDNLDISIENPFSFSARLLTQHLKYISTWTLVHFLDPDGLLNMIHPIISNKYLKSYPELGLEMVEQITDREHYYQVIAHYRTRMDLDPCELNEAILKMDFGIDV